MNLKNKNWDIKERYLENKSELQSVPKSQFPDTNDEIIRTEITRTLDKIQHLTNQIRQQAELNAHNSSMAVPDDIISFRSNGFDIDVDSMPVEKKYSFRFEDSRYIIWKNADDELIMKETD